MMGIGTFLGFFRATFNGRSLLIAALIVCAAAIAGWIRSNAVGDEIGRLWQSDGKRFRRLRGVSLAHGHGIVRCWVINIDQPQPWTLSTYDGWVYSPHPSARSIIESAQPIMGVMGHGWVWQDDQAGDTHTHIAGLVLPYSFIVAASALWPGYCGVMMIVKQRRSSRWIAVRRCGKCGYDLRRSRELCPECGEPVPPRHDDDQLAREE